MSLVTPEEGISRDADAGQPKETVATAVVVPMMGNTVPVVAEMSRGAGGAPEAAAIGESPEDLLASDGMVVKQNFKDIWKVCLCQPNYQVRVQSSDPYCPRIPMASRGCAIVWRWCVGIVAVAIPVASYLSLSTSPLSSRLHAQPPTHTWSIPSPTHPMYHPTPCPV